MSTIIPFYAADQGIVDTLCDIIRVLDGFHRDEPISEHLTPKQLEIFERIVKS